MAEDAGAGGGPAGPEKLERSTLVDVMVRRRSRRFELGDRLQGGALSHGSTAAPVPLSLHEKSVLAFVGAGVSGRVNGELPYRPDAGPETGGGQATIPEYPERDIEAVIAYCEYVFKHYGQSPGNYGPIRTVMAYQAHHIDTSFYDRLYRPGARTQAHADHMAAWHEAPAEPADPGPGPAET